MVPVHLVVGIFALLIAGGTAIFVLLWNRYRDKISAWAAENDITKYHLDRAVVVLDRWVTNITAKVKVQRKDRYYDEEVFEEELTQDQINALKNAHPDWFELVEQGEAVEVDILEQVQK